MAGSLPTRTVGEARGVPLGDAMLLNAVLHRSGFGRLALKSGPAGVESRLESRISQDCSLFKWEGRKERTFATKVISDQVIRENPR